MEASKLAYLMLEWEKKRIELDALESQINAAVEAGGEHLTVGNVRATIVAAIPPALGQPTVRLELIQPRGTSNGPRTGG